MDLLRLIKKMADGSVMVKSIYDVSNILTHINLGIPLSRKKLGSSVNKVGCEDLADSAVLVSLIDQIFTTNMIYRTPELLEREWYTEVNMCKYVAYIVDTLNHDRTISTLLDQSKKIHAKLDDYNKTKK